MEAEQSAGPRGGCADQGAQMLRFHDSRCAQRENRLRYKQTKHALATPTWKYVQQYADTKTPVTQESMAHTRGTYS